MFRNSFWKNTALTVTAIIILFPTAAKGERATASPTAISGAGKPTGFWPVWTRHRATRSFPMTVAPHSCALSATAPGYSIPAAAFLRSPSFLPRVPRTRCLMHGLRRWAAAPAPRTGWPGIPAGITATRTLMSPRFRKTSTAAKRFSAQGISFRSTMDGSAR